MANRKFRKGMLVTMPHNLKYTDDTCGASSTMRSMAGKRERIDSVNENGIISIVGFVWDQRDFKQSKPPKKIPITHFDPEELVI